MPKNNKTLPIILEIDDIVNRKGFDDTGKVIEVKDNNKHIKVEWFDVKAPKWCHIMELQKV